MKRTHLLVLGLFFLIAGLAPMMGRVRSRTAILIPSEAPRIFAGSIVRQGDNFVLDDPADRITYTLDDAKTASAYEGRKVKVLGILDISRNIIRADRIDTMG